MSYSLIIVDSDGAAREIAVGLGRLTIGRGPLNDLVSVGRGVSRQHAILTMPDTIVVEDLDSTYGTKVNDRQVRQAALVVGDHLDIGTFRLVLLPGSERITRATTEAPVYFHAGQVEAALRVGVPQSPFDEPTTAVLTTSELEFTGAPRGPPNILSNAAQQYATNPLWRLVSAVDARGSVTVASTGARSGCSIFIASRTIMVSPLRTRAPGAT